MTPCIKVLFTGKLFHHNSVYGFHDVYAEKRKNTKRVINLNKSKEARIHSRKATIKIICIRDGWLYPKYKYQY